MMRKSLLVLALASTLATSSSVALGLDNDVASVLNNPTPSTESTVPKKDTAVPEAKEKSSQTLNEEENMNKATQETPSETRDKKGKTEKEKPEDKCKKEEKEKKKCDDEKENKEKSSKEKFKMFNKEKKEKDCDKD